MPPYTSNLCHLLVQICQLILQTTPNEEFGWQSYQPHLGTHVTNCGCSLPGLSHISAHTSQTVAAPFRAWPGSPASVARGPIRLPLRALVGAGRIISTFGVLFKGKSKKKVRLHTSYTIAV